MTKTLLIVSVAALLATPLLAQSSFQHKTKRARTTVPVNSPEPLTMLALAGGAAAGGVAAAKRKKKNKDEGDE